MRTGRLDAGPSVPVLPRSARRAGVARLDVPIVLVEMLGLEPGARVHEPQQLRPILLLGSAAEDVRRPRDEPATLLPPALAVNARGGVDRVEVRAGRRIRAPGPGREVAG